MNDKLCFIELEDAYLWDKARYATKIKPEDLPAWYIPGQYCKRPGYPSAKGVTDMVYIPNNCINHFLWDDCLLVSYNGKLTKRSNDEPCWDAYDGVDEVIWGMGILAFLRGTRKYSNYDITDLVKQIQGYNA